MDILALKEMQRMIEHGVGAPYSGRRADIVVCRQMNFRVSAH
jgi:hypothetical protein